jgi:hypothetical protein
VTVAQIERAGKTLSVVAPMERRCRRPGSWEQEIHMKYD